MDLFHRITASFADVKRINHNLVICRHIRLYDLINSHIQCIGHTVCEEDDPVQAQVKNSYWEQVPRGHPSRRRPSAKVKKTGSARNARADTEILEGLKQSASGADPCLTGFGPLQFAMMTEGPQHLKVQWNLTIKTTYGTSWNGLNIEVVSILNHYFSKTNIFHAKMGIIQFLKTHYWTRMVG